MKLESLALRVQISDSDFIVDLLDQTLLPHDEKWLRIETNEQMIEAIKKLRVRGAPLIGVSAAVMIAKLAHCRVNTDELLKKSQELYEARPTAVNLMNCVERMTALIKTGASSEAVVELAVKIFTEDVDLCERMALNGAALVNDGDRILTHCNTGGLATAGIGTALGVIRKAHEQGKRIHVFVDETRPLLQGGRLTAWELQKLEIPYTLITDNMAAHLMSLGKIDKAFVGSDRIAANGDFANKIGTYGVAVACKHHDIPFYVVAPYTTVDRNCAHGNEIPIEQRGGDEVKGFGSLVWAPQDAAVYNPSFDVTPAALVAGWVLDKAVYFKKDVERGVFKL